VLQLLTATGARPEAFALCERWMAAQTYDGPVTWIIVDDGPEPTPVHPSPLGWLQVVVRPAPFWRPGDNTQARNLLKGLDAVDPKHPLVIIEDDDHYRADWLETVVRELAKAELVGECRARYYNIAQRKGRQLRNEGHASLCSTAMRGGALATFRLACQRAPKFIDLELWRRHRSRHLFVGYRVVGIKGLPGRGGIGMGHRDDFRGEYDPDGALLRQWVGDDARFYA
jgi:hypothetical protein